MKIADDYADVARRLRALGRDDFDFAIRPGGAVEMAALLGFPPDCEFVWLRPVTPDAIDYFALFKFSGCDGDWVPFNISNGFVGVMCYLATLHPPPRRFTVDE